MLVEIDGDQFGFQIVIYNYLELDELLLNLINNSSTFHLI